MLWVRSTIQLLEALARRAERRLFTVTGKVAEKPTPESETMVLAKGVVKGFAAAAGLVFLAGFLYFFFYYQSTARSIAEQPLVRNLAAEGFQAKVHFGSSPFCGSDQHPCWAEPDFDDDEWTSVRLPLDPSTNLKALRGYAAGLAADSMYYRLQIPISYGLMNGHDEISFTPMLVQHAFYEIFVNGRPVYSSNGRSILGQIVNIPIRRTDVFHGHASLVIHASVLPGDVGLAHYFQMFVGPKPALDNVYVSQERSFYTYYLLFLLSKGSVFIVFALFFIYTKGQRGMSFFLIYAFFTTLENLFVGRFLDQELTLGIRALCFHLSKTLSTIGLLGFFASYFGLRHTRRWYPAVAIAAVLFTVGMCMDFALGGHLFSFAQMRLVNRLYLLGTLAFAFAVGNLARRMWRRLDATSERYQSLRSFCWLLALFLAFDLWEYLFTSFSGFDQSAVLDLFLFYFVALITARDFGSKEGRIATLEGHMAEKFRMEEELQSAAEIARAFLPDRVPVWPPLEIDVFHRPLTENSGDWFAFERSPGGRFHHFLMCDITGHGVQAAIVVSTCKTVLSSFVLTNPQALEAQDFILQFTKALNATLYQNGHGAHVSTLLGVTFEPSESKLHYFSAGHPLPLLLSGAARGSMPKALVTRHSLLGIDGAYEGAMRETTFAPGDELIAFTDGLPVGSHVKALRRFLAARPQDASTTLSGLAERLYVAVWEAETAKTTLTANDDASVVWFRALAPAKASESA